MMALCFFVMNTKYMCINIEKLLRHTLFVYIYHVYNVSSYCLAPLIKSYGSATSAIDFAYANTSAQGALQYTLALSTLPLPTLRIEGLVVNISIFDFAFTTNLEWGVTYIISYNIHTYVIYFKYVKNLSQTPAKRG